MKASALALFALLALWVPVGWIPLQEEYGLTLKLGSAIWAAWKLALIPPRGSPPRGGPDS